MDRPGLSPRRPVHPGSVLRLFRQQRSAGVLLRRLLSLDYILEHPNRAWLPTEQEKVETLAALEIPKRLFPQRHYHGQGQGQSRYFALNLPLALEPQTATFVYVDPGHDSDKGLLSWGRVHAKLWQALRQQGRTLHVVAVARDHSRQERARKVLRRWTRPGPAAEFPPLSAEEKRKIRRIEQAVQANDQKYLAPYGGFAKAMDCRQMLLDRTEASAPINRIRIDPGKASLSPRVPAEDEA